MIKNEFCNIIQQNIEELRKDVGMTLEEMAQLIGISKKTLIQLEKKRVQLKWPEAVTVAIIYHDHQLIKAQFGDEILEIIQSVSLLKPAKRQLKTLGGESWWKKVESIHGFTLQQHKISKHFRILDQDKYRVYFSYSKSESLLEFKRYVGELNE